jgi:uncharacterized membrane protein YeiH
MEETFLFLAEMVGTIACAISGIRLAAAKNFDWFGAYIVGLVTAIGGGTLRDVLLDAPVFWMQSWWYLAVTALSLATVIVFRNILVSRERILFLFDSIGLAMFCVIGIQKSLALDYPMWVATAMGVITGAFGGVLRDILINEEPMVFRKDIYATACLVGALVYWVILELGGSGFAQQISCAATVILLRVLALRYSLSLPTLAPLPRQREPRKKTK